VCHWRTFAESILVPPEPAPPAALYRPYARSAMTNKEMGALQPEAGRYLLGVVIGEGRYTQIGFEVGRH
jgi:hypothetical protein